jgi:hypothetical protein
MKIRSNLAFLALLAAAVLGGGYAIAQNAGQTLLTFLGSELIQVYPPNTAAIAYTSVASLRDGRQYLYNIPVTGFTITLTPLQSAVSLNPAGTLATGAIVFPPTLVDGKVVTLFSSQTITALTITTSNGATFVPAVVTTLAAGVPIGYVYQAVGNVWHRYL